MNIEAEKTLGPDALLVRLDRLRQNERRAASARVASVIGHLIGTPLNVVAGRAALIRTSTTLEAALDNARRIEEQVDRVAQRVRRIIDYLTIVPDKVEPASVDAVLEETLALTAPVAAVGQVSLSANAGAAGGLLVDSDAALVVLTSLVALGVRSSKVGATLQLSARSTGARVVAFVLHVPDFTDPPARLDRLEPPDHGNQQSSDAIQVLAVCSAMARDCGGNLQLLADERPGTVLSFECPQLG